MSYQKSPRYLLLDEKLNLKQHVDSVIPQINKGISELKKKSGIHYYVNRYLQYIKLFETSNTA